MNGGGRDLRDQGLDVKPVAGWVTMMLENIAGGETGRNCQNRKNEIKAGSTPPVYIRFT
jgi:hypothetical protein